MPFANKRRHREVVEDGAYTTYRYYNADVLKVSKCRSHMIMSDGSHRTLATKNAINDALRDAGIPVCVYQENFQWKIKSLSSAFTAFYVKHFYNYRPLNLV